MAQQNYDSVTRCEAITDLIESVAKEQKALANILNKSEKPGPGPRDYDCYDDYGYDKHPKEKDEEKIELINAVARLDFILAFKLSLFIDCACPKNGCKDHDKQHDYK